MSQDSSYNIFLEEIQALILKENHHIEKNTLLNTDLWKYLISCLSQHTEIIEVLVREKYIPISGYFREILSGEYPIIEISDFYTFDTSYNSGKSDLVPCIQFTTSKNKHSQDIIRSQEKEKSEKEIDRILAHSNGLCIDF